MQFTTALHTWVTNSDKILPLLISGFLNDSNGFYENDWSSKLHVPVISQWSPSDLRVVRSDTAGDMVSITLDSL